MTAETRETRELPAGLDRELCDELLSTITDALGCVEIGRGDREYAEATKAVRALREMLGIDA